VLPCRPSTEAVPTRSGPTKLGQHDGGPLQRHFRGPDREIPWAGRGRPAPNTHSTTVSEDPALAYPAEADRRPGGQLRRLYIEVAGARSGLQVIVGHQDCAAGRATDPGRR